ncbi:cytochrome P450 [Epithele typhae]|uniref:cytochrome P450 n=1 Tax=Epithele typhae TaxID=378194 RepID=UPI0020072F5D|nr:cytochrome P450 [Epithele typhae]KAH9929126.1 cytochrome P450 [Epithele typhae]
MPMVRPWEGLRELCHKYGDILGMTIMGSPVVVLNSANDISQYLDGHSATTSSRPRSASQELLDLTGLFAFMPYGPEWRLHRRTMWQYFTPTAVTKYIPAIQTSSRITLHKLLEAPDRFEEHFQDSVGATLMKVVYGLDAKYENDESLMTIDKGLESGRESLVPGRFLVDVIPILRFLPPFFPSQKRFSRLREQTARMYDMPYSLHKAAAMRGDMGDCILSDMLSQFTSKPDDNIYDPTVNPVGDRVARGVTAVTFAAGSDTTCAVLKTFVLAMSLNPDVLKRAHAETDAVVGPTRLPDLEDRDALPYVYAMYLETLRWMQVVPLGLAHNTTEDEQFGDYFVPAGTMILANIWACMHDPNTYHEPASFAPERFLRDGKLDPEVRNPNDFVFGFGRRICPGRHYAESDIFLTMAHIIHVFDIRPPVDEDGREVAIEPRMVNGFVSWPEDCRCRITPRTPHAATLIVDEFAQRLNQG